jgi:hypothetical protein
VMADAFDLLPIERRIGYSPRVEHAVCRLMHQIARIETQRPLRMRFGSLASIKSNACLVRKMKSASSVLSRLMSHRPMPL